MTTSPSDRYGAFYSRVGIALAWTTTNAGPAAKVCRESGSGSWKKARPLSPEPGAAAGFFTKKLATRNPVIPAVANKLVLFDFDGAPLEELAAQYELVLPDDAWRVPTARGTHGYGSAPPGYPGLKVELTRERVTLISDGYLLAAPGIHPTGLRYELENVDIGTESERPPAVDETLIERLRELAGGGRRRVAELVDSGEPIDVGDRHAALMHHAAQLRGEGLGAKAIRAALEELQERFPEPTGRPGEIGGIVRWVMAKPAPPPLDRDDAELLRALDGLPGARPRARVEEAAGGVGGVERKPKARALFLPFADVRLAGPPRWVWRGKVPEGAVTLVAGRPKLGKSLFAVWLAAQLSRGLLEGAYLGSPAKSLLIAAEDPVDTIVKARLIAAAADETYVGTLASRPPRPPDSSWGLDRGDDRSRPQEESGGLDGLGSLARRIVIPDEYPLLEELVAADELALVVLDPINSFLSSKIDAHRDVEIRRVLDPLAALAARRSFAALAVVHLNRRSDSDVLNRITGSGGYGGSARSILTFGRHPEDPEQRVIAAEGNWQREAHSDLFELRQVVVFPDTEHPDDRTQPALVHVGTTALDSADLIDQLDDDRTVLEQAKDFLFGELAFGAVPVSDLRRGAEAHGISWRSAERAKKLLGVEARRISAPGSERGSGRWEWFLELREEEPSEEDEQ